MRVNVPSSMSLGIEKSTFILSLKVISFREIKTGIFICNSVFNPCPLYANPNSWFWLLLFVIISYSKFILSGWNSITSSIFEFCSSNRISSSEGLTVLSEFSEAASISKAEFIRLLFKSKELEFVFASNFFMDNSPLAPK